MDETKAFIQDEGFICELTNIELICACTSNDKVDELPTFKLNLNGRFFNYITVETKGRAMFYYNSFEDECRFTIF